MNHDPLDNMPLDDAFSTETGLKRARITERRFADSGCRAPLQKQETKRISGSSPVASPIPKSVLSGGREDQLLRE